MKTKHRPYLEPASQAVPKNQSRQLDKTILEQKQNLSNFNHDKNHSGKSHWQDSSSSELDYLKMIREKQQTIKELTEMLEMMNQSLVDERQLKELTNTIQTYEHKISQYEEEVKELLNQTKVLTIENECLIRVIEKNEENQLSQKEDILKRQISELKESLVNAEKQLSETRNNSESASERLLKVEDSMKGLSEQNRSLTDLNKELEVECEKLVRILKEKEQCQTKRTPQCSRGERMTLAKIKEQYQQNLNLTKEYFYQETERIVEQYQRSITSLEFKLDTYTRKVQQLERKKEKIIQQPKQKETSLEIQYIMEKYFKTEKDLEEQRQVNSRLNHELSVAQKTLKQLSLMSLEGSSEIFDVSSSLKKGELSQELLKFNEEISRLKELEKQNSVLKEFVEDLKQKMEHEKMTSSMKMNTVMNCYENQLKGKIAMITEQMEALTSEITHLRGKNSQLDLELKEVNQRLEALTKQNGQLAAQNTTLNQKLMKAEVDHEGQLQELKKDIEAYEKRVEQMKQVYSEKISELQGQICQKGEELDALKGDLAYKIDEEVIMKKNLVKEADPLIETELRTLKSAVGQLNQQNNLLKSNDDNSQPDLQIHNNLKLNQELSELREGIFEKQKHNITLQTHIDTLQHQIESLRYQIKQKSLETTHLEKEKRLIELAHAKPTSLNFQLFVNIVDKLLSMQMKSKKKQQLLECQN